MYGYSFSVDEIFLHKRFQKILIDFVVRFSVRQINYLGQLHLIEVKPLFN